jgi:recombination protein U
MNFRYPNGKRYSPPAQERICLKNPEKKLTYSNRGMTLEDDINETNQYYRENNIAVIHKKPTPVQIVNVNYPRRSAAVITEAYFKQASTTDYNGVYKGKYIDFEAKETKFRTSFPLKNFHQHQVDHMRAVLAHGGICFVIIRFTASNQIFYVPADEIIKFWERMENGGRKSITLEEIEKCSYPIPIGFQPRIDYIKIIDSIYHL